MEGSVRRKMEELRLACDKEIAIQQQRVNSSTISFHKALQSIKIRAEETVEIQVKLGKLKAHLRELEDGLVKALSVKTRKEAKRMAILESISCAKARIQELKKTVEYQKVGKDRYAAIVSQQSLALATLEEKENQEIKHRGDLKEAISWYNRVLGFRIETGHGVKFIFNKVNIKDPNEEYSFTIRYANDIYSLLDCAPCLDDTKELIQELNQTNGLFKFVRLMREKFQAAASIGILPQPTSLPDTSTISMSGPASSISGDSRSESPVKQKELEFQQGEPNRPKSPVKQKVLEFQQGEPNRPKKKVNHGRTDGSAILSPESALSLRRSPRFKVKK